MISVDRLAEELAVAPGDVWTVLDHLDLTFETTEQAEEFRANGVLLDSLAAEVRVILNPQGERTVPELYQ